MKLLKCLLIILAIMSLGFAGEARATLIDQGNGTILDDNTGLYWYQDLDEFDNMTYSQQVAYINTNLGDPWHMATASEMAGLWTYSAPEITGKFLKTFTHPNSGTEFWVGRYDEVVPGASSPSHYLGYISKTSGGAYTKYALAFNQITDDYSPSISDIYGAWVVTPIPPSVLLLGSGLLGLGLLGLRRRNKV